MKNILAFVMLCAATYLSAQSFAPIWAVKGQASTRTDEGKAIVRDQGGNLYVTGYFRERVVIGNDTLRSLGNNRRDIFVAKYNSNGVPQWAKAFPGPVAQDDRGRGIAVDDAGNIYITGEARGALFFDSITVAHNDGTNRNGYVAKLDNDGKVIWAFAIESIGGDDRGYDVRVGPDGRIYVVGQAGNNAVFAPGATPVASNGGADAFLACYTSDGDLEWVVMAGGSTADRFAEAIFDKEGNVWVCGFAGNSATLTFGSVALNGLGESDIILAKYDPSGNVIFAGNFGGDGPDEGASLTYGPNDLLYVGGAFSNVVNIAGQTLVSEGLTDALVIAFDDAGTPVAAAGFGGQGTENVNSVRGTQSDLFVGGFYGLNASGAPGYDITLLGETYPASAGGDGGMFLTQHDGAFAMKAAFAYNNNGGVPADGDTEDVQSIALDPANNALYCTGQFFGLIPFGPDTLQSAGSNSDFYVAAFNYEPTELPVDELTGIWAVRGDNNPRTDEGKALARDAAGNLYVTGYFRERMIIGKDTLLSLGNNRRDIFVAKYDDKGNPQWAKAFPGPVAQDDRGRGIVVDADGNIYVTGEARGPINFGSVTVPHGDGTNRNGFLAKLDNNGNAIWAFAIESVGGDDRGYGVQVGPDGRVYVAGQCGNNTVFAPGADPVPTTGGVDAFVACYESDGTLVWARTGGASGSDRFFDCVFDDDGALWTSGFSGGGASIVFGDQTLTAVGDGDILVARYKLDGELMWVQNFGGPGADEGGALTYGPGGLLYVGGIFSGTATFGSKTFTSNGGTDAVVFALDADGNVANASAFGSVGNENVYAVKGSATDLFVAGFYGLQTAAPGAAMTLGSQTLPGSIGGDGGAFLSQHDAAFNVVSVVGFNGEGGVLADGDSDDVQAIALDADKQRLYITGQFFGTVNIAGNALSTPPGSSNSDYYLAGLRYKATEDNRAFVQVIHNSPDPAAALVDVYLNGEKLLTDFAFRTATPFVQFPAEKPLTIAIAPSGSASAADAVAVFSNIVFDADQRYVVVANGVIDPSAFQGINPGGALNLNVIAPGLIGTIGGPGTFGVSVMHGAPDAPAVDVFVNKTTPAAINDLSYPQATPYLTLPVGSYLIGVAASADSANTLATYRAPLDALNTVGVNAAVVLASGFLNPANAEANNSFGLWAALPVGGALVALDEVRSARIQIAHNSPDAVLQEVDVFLDGDLVFGGFPFRTASPQIELDGNTTHTVGIRPAGSTLPTADFQIFVANDVSETYSVTGLWNPFAYQGVGFSDFLSVTSISTRFDADAGFTALAVQHASPDAGMVDVLAGIPASPLLADFAYKAFTPYLELPTGGYLLAVTPAGNPSQAVGRFYADTEPLDGLAGIVYASGFVNPNNIDADNAFGLWLSLPQGGPMIPLIRVGRAEAQYVHNAPDPAAAVVDVYINGQLAADNFAFRTATAFVEQLSNYPNRIALAPANSTSAADALIVFENVTYSDDERYVVSVNGVIDPASFVGVPANATLQPIVVTPALIASSGGPATFSAAVVHGSPDAPAVDVLLNGVLPPAIDNLAYGQATGYATIPALEYELDVTPAGNNSVLVRRYLAPTQTLSGAAGVLFASGFLDPVNRDGDNNAFGLWLALPDGGPLIPLEDITIAAEEPMQRYRVVAWPNPVSERLYLTYDLPRELSVGWSLYDAQGVEVLRRESVRQPAGSHADQYDLGRLAPGLYWIRMQTEESAGSMRIVKIR
ncbi:MAG: DUF4397 domain-containing protein [Saprospiraceae bacterium]